jgi:hypothetical protein
MAEYCHRAYFWLRPTQYTPLALGLTDLGSSTERWMRALVAERQLLRPARRSAYLVSVKRSCLRIPFGFGASKSYIGWEKVSLRNPPVEKKIFNAFHRERGASVLKNAKAPASSVRVRH